MEHYLGYKSRCILQVTTKVTISCHVHRARHHSPRGPIHRTSAYDCLDNSTKRAPQFSCSSESKLCGVAYNGAIPLVGNATPPCEGSRLEPARQSSHLLRVPFRRLWMRREIFPLKIRAPTCMFVYPFACTECHGNGFFKARYVDWMDVYLEMKSCDFGS